jgi:hypothetical protein
MNVKELREILKGFSDETVVRFSYDNGDYWHHHIAHEVKFVDLQGVEKNDYVEDFVIDDNEEGEFIDDLEDYAVVLS